SIGSCHDRSRVGHLCQGPSGQDHDGIVWRRLNVSRRRRVIQDDGWRRLAPRAVSWFRPMLTDLVGGQGQMAFDNLPASIEHIRAGKLRALAVATTTPSEALPNIPTVADFLPGYEASAWGGLGAPKDTPAEIIHKLNKEINAALGDPRIKARIAELGATA